MQIERRQPDLEGTPQSTAHAADVDEFDLDLRIGSIEITDQQIPGIYASGSCSCSCDKTCTCYSPCTCQTCGTCTCTENPCDFGNTCATSCDCGGGGDDDDW